MDCAPDIATTLAAWLRQFDRPASRADAVPPALTFATVAAPADLQVTLGALAALAAEALARERTLAIVTADDSLLPEISNALDLRLRPLCLVLPGADHARPITLRATLSLLKSRLTRAAADSDGPAWSALRSRLQTEDALWRGCLAWMTRGLDREAPPTGILDLFPVRIGPVSMARQHGQPTDWVMLLQSGQLPAPLCTAWPGARHTLLLSVRFVSGTTDITPIDETLRLRAELDVLGQELAEMELELATAQGEVAAFTARYHALIAGRMTELDRLHADLTQARLQRTPKDAGLAHTAQQARARAKRSQRESHAYETRETQATTDRFAPGDDLKKRFRQLAQKIHPDRASNEAERAWRTQLMSEANRAYRAGDVAALEEVFALWREGQHGQSAGAPGAVSPALTATAVAALTAQRVAIQQRITAIAAELDRLYGSKLYELFTAARMATRHGRELLEEMAQRLDLQIAQAQAELDNLA